MCARFGYSSSTQALVKSPIINLEDGGEAVLTFKGAPYGDDGTKLNITVVGVDGGEATLGQNDFQMTYNQWTNFKTTLKGKGKVRLVIQARSVTSLTRFSLLRALPASAVLLLTSRISRAASTPHLVYT